MWESQISHLSHLSRCDTYRRNGALIAAQGDAVAGASYSYVDTPGYGTFYYKLEDMDYNGVSELHGPITATLAAPFRRPQHRPIAPR